MQIPSEQEQAADLVMEWIEAVEVTRRYLVDSSADYTLDHLYQLHKLRDAELFTQLCNLPCTAKYSVDCQGCLFDEYFKEFKDMQTYD